jgi:hypothetical protein
MGYSSYQCKRCNHGILDANATDEGINEWMAEVVILNPNGRMTVDTEYTGYSGDYERFDGPNAVWLHKACWELAGRPDADAFDGGSNSDEHQGAGGPHAHVIDPRVKDEDERARLLAVGLEKRNARIYAQNARDVHEWMDKRERKYHVEKHGGEMWRLRWDISPTFKRGDDGEPLLSDPNKPWSYIDDPNACEIRDNLNREADPERFEGTEEECKKHLAARWAAFLESDECKAYLAHREAEIAKHKAEEIEKMKTEGRFRTSYSPDHDHRGDTVFYVMDEFQYGSDTERFSTHDHSRKEASGKAKAKAAMLNEAWAAAGFPQEFEHELFTRRTYGDND